MIVLSQCIMTIRFIVQQFTSTKARRKNVGSEKKLHQKMRRPKAQLMDMFSVKSEMPLDSSYLPDSATVPEGQLEIGKPPTGPL